MIWLATGALVAPAIGFLFVAIAWPEKRFRCEDLLLRFFLSVGLGFGLVSLTSFIILLATRNWVYCCLAEIPLLIGLGYLALRRSHRTGKFGGEAPRNSTNFLGMDLMVLGIFASVTVLSLANTVILYLESPHGQWDAWMIWNLRARFLFKGPGFWEQFSDAASAFSHYDYPLMIPVSVARLWYFTGGSITIAPMLLASLFTYAAAGLLLCVTWKVRGRTNALLAAATLLGTRHFVFSGASQQADVALAFFFLATICLFLLNDAVGESGGGLLMLAGASAGLALWTKNEGWLFLLAVAAARITATVAMSGRRRCLKELACFGLGLCPALGVAVIQKIQFASSNDLISGDRINIILPLLADPFRYLQILKEFAGQLFVFHRWGYVAPVLLIYPCLVGVHVEGDQRKSLLFGAATLGLMLVGYFFVYVITPHDLLWHLRHSLDRLFIQLWPSFLLIFFGLVVGPRGSERG